MTEFSTAGKSRPFDPNLPLEPPNDVSDSTDRRVHDGAGAAQPRSRPSDLPRRLAVDDLGGDDAPPPPRLVKERPLSPARPSQAYGQRRCSPQSRSEMDDDYDGSESDGAPRRGPPAGRRRSRDDRPAHGSRGEAGVSPSPSPSPSPMSSPRLPEDDSYPNPNKSNNNKNNNNNNNNSSNSSKNHNNDEDDNDANDGYDDRRRYERGERGRSRSPSPRGRRTVRYDARSRSPSPSPPRHREHYRSRSPPDHRYDSRSPSPPRRRGNRGGGRARARRRSPPRRRPDWDDETRRGRKRPLPDDTLSPEEELVRRACTVFVSRLPPSVTDDEVAAHFESAGAVADVQLINDPRTRRPLGYGFVEFRDAVAVPAALALNKSEMRGHCIEVQMPPLDVARAPSGRSLAPAASQAAPGAAMHAPGSRVHVANLPSDASEADVMSLFQLFGKVVAVTIPRGGGSRINYGFVQFESPECAARAIAEGTQLAFQGRELRVSPVKDPRPLAAPLAAAMSARLPPPFFVGLGLGPGMGMGLAPGGLVPGVGGAPFPVPGVAPLPPASTPAVSPLDDGVMFDARSRAALMSKLALAPSAAAPAAVPPDHSSPRPTRTLRLSPMFDERESVQEPVLREIENDCRSECAKFGHVLRVHAVRGSAGQVAVEFVTVASAVAALSALQGRFFAGQKLAAVFLEDAAFPS